MMLMLSGRSSITAILLLALLAGGYTHAQKKNAGFREQTATKAIISNNNDAATEDEPKLSRKERKKKLREQRKKQKEERRLKHEEQKKEERKADADRKSRKRQLSSGKEPLPAPRKKHELTYPPTKIKSSYRIDVLIPLYLDELVKGDAVTFKDKMPEKAVQGLTFYQGLKLAADSLKKAGFNLDIYIHDVSSFTQSAENLVNDRRLDSADLIIGAVQQHDIPVLAAYARKKKINFVSALSPNDGYVKNNAYFTVLQPTIKSHCEYITDDMSKKYAGQKVALLYRTLAANDDNASQYLLKDSYSDVRLLPLLCNIMPSKQDLLTVIDPTKPNIVAVPVMDIAYADSLLHALTTYFPLTHFEVYGMPTWAAIASLRKANVYNNLTVNVTYPLNYEQQAALAATLDKAYRKEYGVKATDMVYHGYETLYWYAWLLARYGTMFNTSYKDNSAAPFTQFEVKPRWDANGGLLYQENRHVYLSTYQGGVYKTE